MVHSCLKDQAPQYLIDFCLPRSAVTSRQRLRSASRQLLDVPRYTAEFCYPLPDVLSLWQARRFGTHCQSTWETRPSAEAVSKNSWKRFCLQRTNAYSALEVLRQCAIYTVDSHYITSHCITYTPPEMNAEIARQTCRCLQRCWLTDDQSTMSFRWPSHRQTQITSTA